ncbi:MAG: ABC transporter permease, partial [Gemmatimonadaceae bacterium]
ANNGHVALVSEGFWRQRLGGSTRALGHRLTLDDSVYTIIGVMPASLVLPNDAGREPAAFWLPLDARANDMSMQVVGRLRLGATATTAERELDSLYTHATASSAAMLAFKTVIMRPGDRLSFRDSLIMLAAAVALVLLIACANVAHLLIGRGAARQRELAIRAALGAGRARLLRQLLTESLMLSSVGAAIGVGLGWIGLVSMIALRPASLTELAAARLDGTTLGVALGVTVASGLIFGLIGLLQSARHSTNDSLKGDSAGRSPRIRARARDVIVVTEMALSATLLICATLLVRSVIKLQHANLGFDAVDLYQVSASVPKAYREPAAAPARAAYLAGLVGRLRRAGGVVNVSIAAVGPSGQSFSMGRLEVDGEPHPTS